jgi:hypothetical protein
VKIIIITIGELKLFAMDHVEWLTYDDYESTGRVVRYWENKPAFRFSGSSMSYARLPTGISINQNTGAVYVSDMSRIYKSSKGGKLQHWIRGQSQFLHLLQAALARLQGQMSEADTKIIAKVGKTLGFPNLEDFVWTNGETVYMWLIQKIIEYVK